MKFVFERAKVIYMRTKSKRALISEDFYFNPQTKFGDPAVLSEGTYLLFRNTTNGLRAFISLSDHLPHDP
jgi:hypothetical protein